ncbi:hypothetical protein [Odoribacter laneus]|uniref:hypothetical protein n=1 Tax=Odoribacter laneus TaxID=626933 RepID=UPI003AF9AC41
MKKYVLLFIFFIIQFSLPLMAQEELSEAGRSHWRRAQIYIEEAKDERGYEYAISELWKLLETDEFPEAYLELGRMYSQLYSPSEKINEKAQHAFERYMTLKPEKREETLKEMDRFAVKREMKLQAFYDSITGKWGGALSKNNYFGFFIYDIEIKRNGYVYARCPATYTDRNDRVASWQNKEICYWNDYDFYQFEYSVKVFDEDGVQNGYHISYTFKPKQTDLEKGILHMYYVLYINQKWVTEGEMELYKIE